MDDDLSPFNLNSACFARKSEKAVPFECNLDNTLLISVW